MSLARTACLSCRRRAQPDIAQNRPAWQALTRMHGAARDVLGAIVVAGELSVSVSESAKYVNRA